MPVDVRLTQRSSDTYVVGDLIKLATSGRLRIPRFQRSFVWDKRNIRDLFDSIWKGYPVGTLLLWQNAQPSATVEFGSVVVDAPARDDALVAVDGQQRLTTLVAALAPDPKRPPESKFEVWFDLRLGRFVHEGQGLVPDYWLPVRVALESRTLIAWLRDNGDDLNDDDRDQADAVAGALRDYKIPAYVIREDNEEILRDVFDRVNSAGRPINRAEIFHALFGGDTEAASSAAVVAELRRERFGDLDEQRVVQSLLAIRGGDVGRDVHNEFDSDENPAEWFDLTAQALGRVIRFLRRLGVPHLDLVPSALPIPVLAAYFYVHPQPDPYSELLLGRWVWRGWAHGYGRAGQTPALRQAVRTVNPVKLAVHQAPSEFDAVADLLRSVPSQTPPIGEDFNSRSAIGKLALLALADLGPKRPDGEPLDLTAAFAASGTEVVALFARAHGSKLGARGLWNPQDPLPSGREDPAILASHEIDAEAAGALRAGDVTRFVEHRGGRMQKLVRDFLTEKLDPGAPLIRPLTELSIPDPT